MGGTRSSRTPRCRRRATASPARYLSPNHTQPDPGGRAGSAASQRLWSGRRHAWPLRLREPSGTWPWPSGQCLPLSSGPQVPLRDRLRLLLAIARLFVTLLRGGGRLGPVLLFLRSRNYPSQILLAAPRRLVFLTSAPYTYNQDPWVIEIEDPTTLFFPFIHNGSTSELNLADSPYFPVIRALLESDQCRAIVTHMRSTAWLVPKLFQSEIVARKIRYLPLGVRVPERWQMHDEDNPELINLLYTNSWSQHPGNLQVRGGLDVLEAFSILRERYPQLRLTMRTSLIPLDEHYHRVIESGWVRVIHRFLTAAEMETLHAESHIFLLPAARVHIVSLLQAMASGLALVASDGWGFSEYVTHERNGLVVKGRYGKTSWADEEAGMLREDYEPTFSPDPEVVQGIVQAVSRLVEDHELRRRLGLHGPARRGNDVQPRLLEPRAERSIRQGFDGVNAFQPGSAHRTKEGHGRGRKTVLWEPRRAEIRGCPIKVEALLKKKDSQQTVFNCC